MKIRKLISLLVATAMTVTALMGAMSVTAVNSISNELKGEVLKGKCGESAEWLINSDGVLVISGTGEMSAYADDKSTDWGWRKYGDDINKVVIEDGITSTNSNSSMAFIKTFMPNVSCIIIPPSFIKITKTIGYVNEFNNLKDIYIYSKNVTDVETGSEVIWHVYKDSNTDKSLRSNGFEKIEYIPDNEQMPTVSNKTPVELEPITDASGPSGLTSKYEYNESSKTLTFSGTGNISIYDYYKNYAEETEHIVIEKGITKITCIPSVQKRQGAFTDFKSLKSINLPNTMTETPHYMCTDCTNLEEINLENISIIGESAFSGCSKLKSINLHEGMTIGGAAFCRCKSLKEVIIPKNVTFRPIEVSFQTAGMKRDPVTFSECENLEKIIIEDGCWLGDSWENEITPNGIPTSFCSSCPSLKTVVIKGNVEYIGNAAFLATVRIYNYSSLADIYFYNTGLKTITPTSADANKISIDCSKNPTFHVVKGSTTEQTLIDAGYLNDENTVYIADTTALETAISEAETIETDKYTDETVSALTKAIENAKAVLENLNATQEEVDNAVKAINDAKNALADKSGEPSTDNSSDPSNSSDNNNQSQSPNTPATPPTAAPTTATPKPTTPPTVTTTAKPAKVKNVKLKAKKKKLSVSWKKVSGATGYEIQYATNNKFTKNKKTVTVKKNKVTLKKLKPKKKYFVKVRAYKLANGRKYFGKWSKVVKKKVK